MGLLDWIKQDIAAPNRSQGLRSVWLDGDTSTWDVVGESRYQPALLDYCAGQGNADGSHSVNCVALLVPEPGNEHDPNAVRVTVNGQTVGYLAREDAVEWAPVLHPLLDRGEVVACNAHISGRWGGETDNLGVFLKLPDPEVTDVTE